MISRNVPRTRGPMIPPARIAALVARADTALPLESLLDELRDAAGGLPLTITVHGWGNETAAAVVNRLAAMRDAADTIWICTDGDENARSAEERNDVLPLNMTVTTDVLLFNNLVVDAAFFPATEQREMKDVASLGGRCAVVLIHDSGPLQAELIAAAWNNGLTTCTWSGNAVTEYSTSQADVLRRTVDKGVLNYDRLAKQLTERVEFLSDKPDRRLMLRSLIGEVLAHFPDDPALRPRLIEQAHKRDWDEWAVEALGAFWVPIDNGAKESTAYAWRYLLECIPAEAKVNRLDTLCRGVIEKVRVPARHLPVIQRLAEIFAREVGEFPYPSDAAFAGAINNAMQEAEAAMARNAKARRQINQARRRFLERAKLPA